MMVWGLIVWIIIGFPLSSHGTEVAIAQSAAPTSNGGTQDFTVSGFGSPLCAMFFATAGTANGTAVSDAMLAVGVTDFTNSYSIASMSEDAQATTDTGASSGTTALRTLASTNQAVDGTATASVITDGARLTWSDAPPSAYLINAVLFGGANVSNCSVGTLAANASVDSTASTTAPGFQPDLIVFITANGTTHNRNSIGLAVNDGGVVQRSIGMADQDSATGAQVVGVIRDERIVLNPSAGTGLATVELTSFDTNGFTMTTRDSTTSIPTVGYMAIKFGGGVSAKLVTCAAPTATGMHSCTGAGWTPQAGIMLHTESLAVGTYYSTDDGEVLGISAFSVGSSASSAIYVEDSDGTSNSESISSTNPVRLRKDGADFMSATLSQFNADGVELNYSVTPASARQRAVLFIKSSAGSSSMLRRRMQ